LTSALDNRKDGLFRFQEKGSGFTQSQQITKQSKKTAVEISYGALFFYSEISGNIWQLEFHHVGKKSWKIGRMVAQGYPTESIAAEISQCIVLCANCHRRLTAEENGWYKGK